MACGLVSAYGGGTVVARKDNSRNPLQLSLRARSLPRGVTPKRYFARLMDHVKTGRPLPESWDVEIGWRNPGTASGRTKEWQFDNFEDAVSDSRDGFNSLLYDVLRRKWMGARG